MVKIPQTLFMEWLQDVFKMDLDEFITILGEMYEARVYGGWRLRRLMYDAMMLGLIELILQL